MICFVKLLINKLTLLLNLGIDRKIILKWFSKEDVNWINLDQNMNVVMNCQVPEKMVKSLDR
jgi:hypothetical protein